MPLTLLDEVPPAGSVPVLGLLRIHRRETKLHGPAALPGPVPDAFVRTGRTYPRLPVNRLAEEVTHKLACELREPLVDCVLHEA